MRRKGFTLVEVLVALTVSGVVVLVTHGVFAGAAAAGRTLVHTRANLDRAANGVRWLRAALASLDVGEGAGGFEGKPDRVTFAAWLQQPGQWFERSRFTIALQGNRVVVAGLPWIAPVLADSVVSLGFDYLLEPGEESVWVREWSSPVSAPLAVRMRLTTKLGTDTVLLIVGPRG